MPNYIKGQEILDTYDIKGFELLDYVQRKVLHPYNSIGKPEPPPNISRILGKKEKAQIELMTLMIGNKSLIEKYTETDPTKWDEWDNQLEYEPLKDILNSWDKNLYLQLKNQYPDEQDGFFRTKNGDYISIGIMDRCWKLHKELSKYEEELSEFKKGKYTWSEYKLSPLQKGFELVIDALANSLYSSDEASKVFGANEESEQNQTESGGTDREEFVSNLTFSIESDNEISIKISNKKSEIIEKSDLGVQDKTWRIFQSMVRDGYYRIPHKGSSKQYNTEHKTLGRISEKIVIFLNSRMGASIPATFKVIINDKHQRGPNCFRPVFNVGKDSRNKSKYDRYPDNELIKEFKSKAKAHRKFGGTNNIDDEFIEISKAVKERELLTNEEIKDEILHKTDADTIKNEFNSKLDKSEYKNDPDEPKITTMEVTDKP